MLDSNSQYEFGLGLAKTAESQVSRLCSKIDYHFFHQRVVADAIQRQERNLNFAVVGVCANVRRLE